MKICSLCKLELSVDNFHIKTKKNNKIQLQPYCKECNKLYHKNHYKKNKKDYIEKNKQYKKNNQENLLNYFQGKFCKDCGITDYRVFEFDHLANKKAEISKVLHSWSWQSILKEINKCDLVCCNCHRIRTLERAKSYRTSKVDNQVEVC